MNKLLHLCLICLSISISLGSCAVDQNSSFGTKTSLQDELFNDNLSVYATQNPAYLEIIEKLEKYKRGFNTLNIETISGLISPDFEFFYTVPDADGSTLISVQNYSEFIEKRGVWIEQSSPVRNIEISIQSVKQYGSLKQVVITAATTVHSQHFSPRFIEVFLFQKSEGHYLLFKHMVTPLYPKKPEDYEVDVFFTELKSDYYDLKYTDIRREMIAVGPDAAFEKYVERFSKTAPFKAREQKIPLIVIFREPPPKGSTIEIIETGGGSKRYYSFQTVTSEGDPYYFLANQGWWGSGYSVDVKVILDGVTIHRETLRLPR